MDIWKRYFQTSLKGDSVVIEGMVQQEKETTPERNDRRKDITTEELRKVIQTKRNGKAPGHKGIAASVIKALSE